MTRSGINIVALAGALMVNVSASPVFGQRTQLVSTLADGSQGTGYSREPSISQDGRYVCFETVSRLVAEDTNRVQDVYVKDMLTGEVKLCSRNSNGVVGNRFSGMAQISADGSVVAFMSTATNLIPNNPEGLWYFYVHDLASRETALVSVNSQGERDNRGANCNCMVYKFPCVSTDGRYVAFHSIGSNLVENDNNETFDIFRHDRLTGQTVRVTVSHDGGDPDGFSFIRNMSPDGRFIVYQSTATNLVPDDSNQTRDIFIRDMDLELTERCSIAHDGSEANDASDSPDVTPDGRYVAFASLATNLVIPDTNDDWDVFLRDRLLQTTERISIKTDGSQPNGYGRHPSISEDGRWITFHSDATNHLAGMPVRERRVMLRDRLTRETVYVAIGLDGPANERSLDGFISDDGKWVVFDSYASNLVPEDNNGARDIFRLERFGDHLELLGPVPGRGGARNRWAVDGVLPGSRVVLMYDTRMGNSPIEGCDMINLDLADPRIVGSATADASGRALILRQVPPGASGRIVRFQAYSPTNCARSNVIVVQFE